MTPRAFCQSGTAETAKAVWHGVTGVLVLGAFAYNGVAFALRRQPHLLVNAVVYGCATGFEAKKVLHHLGRL